MNVSTDIKDVVRQKYGLAEENRHRSGLTNVEFLKGEIENIPLRQFGRRDHLELRDQPDDARALLGENGLHDDAAVARAADAKFVAAFVRATKP